MKRSAIDTSNTTLQGTLSQLAPDTTPPGWQFRLLYGSIAGIVESAALKWDGKAPLQMGRRSSSPDGGPWLHLPDERASREHARIYSDGGHVLVADLKSRNGTSVNGTALAPGEIQPLRDGDVLRCGDAFIMVRYEPELADVRMPSLIGQSRAACMIRRAVTRSALSKRSVLLLGETGTGKEVVAQSIHRLSQLQGTLIAVNCAAVPETLAEAQFFGVKKGAYTGAVEQRGAFLDAHHGTLFLDEIGELPLTLQAKLLRALETREVTPIGASRPLPADVRVLSATNRDLMQAMARKEFREDLYARLAGEVLNLPPLRDRREDVLLLLRHFGGPELKPSPRFVAALLAHAWPFNIREVSNVVGRLRDGEDGVIAALQTTAPSFSAPSFANTPTPAPTPTPAGDTKPRWKSGDAPPSREQVIALLTQYQGNLYQIEREHGFSRRQFRRWAEEKYALELAQYRAKS